MTLQEVRAMVESIGLPYCYYQFKTGPNNPPPPPPFVCFFYPNSDDAMADNINYAHINALVIELYTDDRDFVLESQLEAVLIAHNLPYTWAASYIDSEQMHLTTYNTEVLINA